MRSDRAQGHVSGPTPDDIKEYEETLGFSFSGDERALYAEILTETVRFFDQIEEFDAPEPRLRHVHRDPGRPPTAEEDPYNAFVRLCEVVGAADGPLADKRIGVKDCIMIAGVPMTNGGRRQPVLVPVEDAVVIERLLDAGATIAGTTNMEDMASGLGEGSAFGAARNPTNPHYSPGGSSSGSGAAVASRAVDMALGVDQAGSVRVPSAWCGIVGMKATHGLVPSHGITYVDHTLDHVGPMTRTVADNALLLEVIAGADDRDPQWVRAEPQAEPYSEAAGHKITDLRIGVISDALEPIGSTSDVLEVFQTACAAIEELGATITQVEVPLWTHAWAIEMATVTHSLASMFWSSGQGFCHWGRAEPHAVAVMGSQVQNEWRDMPLFWRANLLTAEHIRRRYKGVPYARAQNLRRRLRRDITNLFADNDLLISPTTPVGPFELLDRRGEPLEMMERMVGAGAGVLNTCALNLTGHPAITVPSGSDANGLPLGTQIIGPHFGEMVVYQAAFSLEAQLAAAAQK